MSNDWKLFNDMFRSYSPTRLNACVGDNGLQDAEVYAQGYMKSSLMILEKIIEDESLSGSVDLLVFPVAFCIRHSVELCLKESILSLRKMRDNHDLRTYGISSTHNLQELWCFFEEQSVKIDRRYIEINQKIKPYVLDIAEIDPTGQTFRYPFGIQEEKHLVRTPVINLANLRARFIELCDLLDELFFANRSMCYEYGHCAFTDELSRYDLYLIVGRLPEKSNWGCDKFSMEKEAIRQDYNLSSRKFSRAVDVIKAHYELSSLVGIVVPLKSAKAESFRKFFSLWDKYHENDGVESGWGYFSVEDIMKSNELERKCVECCVRQIPLESLADIFAIYELGREGYPMYSEFYVPAFDRGVRELRRSYREGDGYEEVDHYLSKVNGKEAVMRGLHVLGQREIVDYLEKCDGSLRELEKFDPSKNYPYPLDGH